MSASAIKALFMLLKKVPKGHFIPNKSVLYPNLKKALKKFGSTNTREMAIRGVSIAKKQSRLDAGPTIRNLNLQAKKRLHLHKLGVKKDSKLGTIFGSRPQFSKRIPYELQNWKSKVIKPYINKSGEVIPRSIHFWEPKIGAQSSVNHAKHLAGKSSGGYGGQTFRLNVGGHDVTIKGPWSSRPGSTRVFADKSFVGWDEMSAGHKNNLLNEYNSKIGGLLGSLMKKHNVPKN